MNRRNFLMVGAAGAAVMATAIPVLAQVATDASEGEAGHFSVATEIGNNHGHALALTVDTVILAMQKARVDGSVVMDIKGQSGHPHAVSLTLNDLVDLLSLGTLSVVSSKDAGHTHSVKISLVEA